MAAGLIIIGAGKGNHVAGSPPADVVFVLRQALHPRYERRGHDLHLRLPVPLVTALTGGTVELTTLDQRTLSLTLAEVVTPHSEHVVMGEGMPISRSPGQRGNLHVTFEVRRQQGWRE